MTGDNGDTKEFTKNSKSAGKDTSELAAFLPEGEKPPVNDEDN